MNAARAELVRSVIRPALDRGDVIISDRYWYSTLAYQSAGDGVPEETVRDLALIATGETQPDAVILLDLPPQTGLERISAEKRDVLDRRRLDFHVRVREAYRQMASEDPGHWIVVDAGRPSSDVAGEVRRQVLARIDLPDAATIRR